MSQPPHGIFDTEQIDHLLTTTRSVRKKLDLQRPVEDDVLLRMIDIAEQTPSGSNQASRRWVIIRDPLQKQKIAQLYREFAIPALSGLTSTAEKADDRGGAVISSGLHLANNIENVPALVIATIYGVHDGSGKPSLFDSVIQAAWNFCLAGRARGIGTAWTTMHLERASEVADVLGIPAGVTQVVLLPVAYTTTTEFHPAARQPATDITFFDHWGFTPSAIPAQRRSHPGEGRGVSLEVDITATPEQLWPLVTDITLPGKFSSEATHATWVHPDATPGVGSVFTGRNHSTDAGHQTIDDLIAHMTPDNSWETRCRVTAWRLNREFSYCVGDDPERVSAHWRFSLQPLLGGGTRVTHAMRMGPGESGTSAAMLRASAKSEEIMTGRFHIIRDNIGRTLKGIEELAESSAISC